MSRPCSACTASPVGICSRHEDAAEERANAAAEARADRLYGDAAEHAFESMVYGESRWF